jgi:hypothetical protein
VAEIGFTDLFFECLRLFIDFQNDFESNLYFGPRPLDYTNEYKYLGIIFDNKGKIRIAAENLAYKARKAYFALMSKLPYSKLDLQIYFLNV